MKTKVRLNEDIIEFVKNIGDTVRVKKGDIGYIDGYTDGYAVVVFKDKIIKFEPEGDWFEPIGIMSEAEINAFLSKLAPPL